MLPPSGSAPAPPMVMMSEGRGAVVSADQDAKFGPVPLALAVDEAARTKRKVASSASARRGCNQLAFTAFPPAQWALRAAPADDSDVTNLSRHAPGVPSNI